MLNLKGSLTKDGLVREFKDFLETMKQHSGNNAFVAFDYLQIYLRTAGKADLLIESCEDLVQAFPTSPFAVFNLAQNQFALNKREDALRTLGHAKASDIPGWEKFAKEQLNDGEEVQLRLQVKRILVVDPDESIQNQIRETLGRYTDKVDIRFETNGETAIKWLEGNSNIDLIIQEWRIPGLTGHVFRQRTRQVTSRVIPVVVLSSLLKKDDVPILNEMSVSTGIEKPIEEKSFIKALFNALVQHSSPTTPKWIERKIQEKLNLKDSRGVQKLYKRLSEHPGCTDDQRYYIQALRFYHAEDYESARLLCAKAIQYGGDQVKTFTLLGRCLNNLREFAGAVKCFEKAQSLSPKNIERLCELAEAQVEAGNEEAAQASLEKAKEMDATNQMVQEAEAKVAIKTGNTEKARELMYHMGSIDQLISDMNGSAVALVRIGKFEQGVDLYNKTLDSIPSDDEITQSRVLYNLALAFARKGDLPSAKMTVDRASIMIAHPVKDKIASLKLKLEKAIASQAQVKLSSAPVSAAKASESNPWEVEVANEQQLMSEEPVIPGTQLGALRQAAFDRGIMGIVRLPESVREGSAALVKTVPVFNLRSAIERAEGMGAEKLAQDAS